MGMMAVVLFASSCTQESMDPLTGKYPTPTDYAFTSLTSQTSEKAASLRIFTLELATASGDELYVEFVGDAYYLHAAAFSPANAATARKGNFIVGTSNSGTRLIKGNTTYPIVSGQLTVALSGASDYTITGVAWLDNGEPIRVQYTGTIVYEPDPEPVALTQIMQTTVTPQPDGTNQITLHMGTEGITVTPGAYGSTYGGTGKYLTVDFISTDATLAAGTYTPANNGATANGNYVKGYDFYYEAFDFWMYNWGTCWFSMEDGTATGAHIETGDITVAKSGSTYTITINNGDVFAQYTGAIEALSPVGDNEPIALTNLFNAADNSAMGSSTITLKIASAGLEPSYNAATWSWEFSGTGTYISIDLYSADGTLSAGTYTAAESSAIAEGNWVIGYDFVDWGMYNFGTCWFEVANGVPAGVHLETGTIEVTDNGDGTYTIDGDFGDVVITYTGAVAIPTP
jgi:hypothetical protein